MKIRKLKKPRDLNLPGFNHAQIFPAGVSTDTSCKWKAEIDIRADSLGLKEAKRLHLWLNDAILWLEKNQ